MSKLNWGMFITGTVLFLGSVVCRSLAEIGHPLVSGETISVMMLAFVLGIFATSAAHTFWEWMGVLARKRRPKASVYELLVFALSCLAIYDAHIVEATGENHAFAIWFSLFWAESVISQGFVPFVKWKSDQDATLGRP